MKWLKWIGGIFLGLLLGLAILVAVFDWNWARGTIGRMVSEKTGRTFAINGDLDIKLGWPTLRVHARQLSFANPAWSKRQPMASADGVAFTLDVRQWWSDRRIVLPDVQLARPSVALEIAPDGRKNWLLDREQRDEQAVIRIDRLIVDRGRIRFDDTVKRTSLDAEVSSLDAGKGEGGTEFRVSGQYQGEPLNAQGKSGPVLGLRDQGTPYPLSVDASIGSTTAKADGTITGLVSLSAIDMQTAVSGGSLEKLYPLIGIALPDTRPYRLAGRLVRQGKVWRYENFSGRIGGSDMRGSLRVELGAVRPFLQGDLLSQVLDFADLGPVIGAQPEAKSGRRGRGKANAAASTPASADDAERKARRAAVTPRGAPASARPGGRVLPDAPFRTERWQAADADVKVTANRIRRPDALPIDNLVTRLQMREGVLTLDPLSFGVAGGTLAGKIRLDGKQQPIEARADIKARQLQLGRLLPPLGPVQVSRGHASGDFELAARGGSVAAMLGSANGKAALVVDGGRVSQLMIEAVGLHLWEMLQLTVGGDQPVKIRCLVADFTVKDGVLHSNTLLFDTDVTTVVAHGNVDLGKERLDLTLTQRTKDPSPVSLRSPIHIGGSFAEPDVSIDKGALAARSAGAIALGLINPLLALLPLVETGPGMDSNCGRLIREAQKPAPRQDVRPGRAARSARNG
jgi:uncharacterized protein involved in outer membrane biogenesis